MAARTFRRSFSKARYSFRKGLEAAQDGVIVVDLVELVDLFRPERFLFRDRLEERLEIIRNLLRCLDLLLPELLVVDRVLHVRVLPGEEFLQEEEVTGEEHELDLPPVLGRHVFTLGKEIRETELDLLIVPLDLGKVGHQKIVLHFPALSPSLMSLKNSRNRGVRNLRNRARKASSVKSSVTLPSILLIMNPKSTFAVRRVSPL